MHEELCQIKNSVKREWVIKGSGGGRINHNPSAKTVNVHGYCYTFGTADHRNSIELWKKNPDYAGYEMSWEYEKEFNCAPEFHERKALAAAKEEEGPFTTAGKAGINDL